MSAFPESAYRLFRLSECSKKFNLLAASCFAGVQVHRSIVLRTFASEVFERADGTKSPWVTVILFSIQFQ